MSEVVTIRTVIYQEGDLWLAQCLEYDIGAQAPDVSTLQSRLEATMMAELNESLEVGDQPFGKIEPAPARFFELWDKCSGKLTLANHVPLRNDGQEYHLDLALCA